MNNLNPAHQPKTTPGFKMHLEHTPKGLTLFIGLDGGTIEHGFPVHYADLESLLERAGRLVEAA